ncbi:transcriptional regulatory protein YedW [Candidatus Pelagibacterales bacterium]|jgi:DNA-binding response OmpR family regulator
MNNIHLYIYGSKVFLNIINELNLGYNLSTEEVNPNKKNNPEFIVRIVFPEELKLIEVKKYFTENIPTIFFLKDKSYLLKNKLSLLNFHQNLSLPVDILSFREILNILITKYSFFKKSKITINNYEIDSNQRIITREGTKVKLTEKELDLILFLNNHSGLEKSLLLKKIWNHNSELETHAFETHLHRLRKKIERFFKDKKFITEKNSLYYLSK